MKYVLRPLKLAALFISLGCLPACSDDFQAGTTEKQAGTTETDAGTTETQVKSLLIGEGPHLLSGRIERVFEDFTWNNEFKPVQDAHIEIYVFYFDPGFADPLAQPIVIYSGPFQGLPLLFEVRTTKEIPPGNVVSITATVYNHDGTNGKVGDLTSEYANRFPPGTSNVAIAVSGLESCSGANAGGFCVD